MRGGGNSFTHWRIRGGVWLEQRATEGAFFFSPCAAVDIHSLTGGSGGALFFCSVRGGGNSLTHWRVRGCVWLEQRARFFFLLRARRGIFTPSLARLRLCVVEKAGAFFFLLRARRGEIHSLTGASGGAFFFCSVRGGGNSLTHSRIRGRVFFFAVCAAVDIHSLTGASGGDSLTHWRVRGRVFFLLRARRGKFTHSLARPRLCVVGTEGAFFFLLRARRGKFTPSLARLRLCVVEKAGAFFFLLRARQGEIHSLTGASGGAFFFCSVRGGGNSLTHWRVHGCVWFFLLFARRGKFTHSLARPGALFFCLLCARRWTFTHSLARPGARFFFCSVRGGGNSLTHWRVRGCVWLEQRARFFFAPCAAGQAKKKKHGARFFFVRHAAGRAKKKLFSRARRAKKKHIFRTDELLAPIPPRCVFFCPAWQAQISRQTARP